MSSPGRLRLFGVVHTDRLEKVTDELAAFGDGAEAIFLEGDVLTAREYGRVALRAPFLLFGFAVYWLVLSPSFLALNRDVRSTEQVAVERVAGDRPIHYVDEHPLRRLLDASGPVTAGNWIAIGLFAAFAPVATAATIGTVTGTFAAAFGVRLAGHRLLACLATVLGYVAIGAAVVRGLFSAWIAATTFLAAVAAVFRTVDRRNEIMLDRIETIAADAGYGDAVLVTGKGHLGGLVRQARDRDLAVPAVHVSRWLRAGEARPTVDAERPASDAPAADLSDRSARAIRPGSERRVFGRRLLAGLADSVLAGFAGFVVLYALALAHAVSGSAVGDLVETLALPALLGGFVGYFLLLEGATGSTVGKRLLGLSVANVDGTEPTRRQLVIRNLARFFELALLYVPSVCCIALSGTRGRPGDLIAKTVVGRRTRDATRDAEWAGADDPAEPAETEDEGGRAGLQRTPAGARARSTDTSGAADRDEPHAAPDARRKRND